MGDGYASMSESGVPPGLELATSQSTAAPPRLPFHRLFTASCSLEARCSQSLVGQRSIDEVRHAEEVRDTAFEIDYVRGPYLASCSA